MAIEKINIEQFLELAKQHPVIDVRSPAEYNHAHIPGAYSLPLFTDEERKVVGTTYKQESREAAIKIGLDYFGPKMSEIVRSVESIVGSQDSGLLTNDLPTGQAGSRLVLTYCWRGGMRSAAIAWLLDLYGFKVFTLIGGYKKFRNYVLDTFKLPFQFNILGGYTGSGKTELLKALKEKGETIIDLEKIAKHKGSAFGNIGMSQQPTQEMFENILAQELRRSMGNSEWSIQQQPHSPFTIHYSPLWLEDESQRIGHVNIPNDLWATMRKSHIYFLDIPFEERLKHIVEEYGCLDKQKMMDAIERIKEKLGGQNAKLAIQLLEEGNTEESFRILLKYYDKFYFRSLHNREGLNSLLHTVECKSVNPENASQLIRHIQYQIS
ncbi:MAG: tRNA 2-selenouridine(34) synthase MnmH [Sphingobacteriales bacterium]|nr:tRNA 2-selenouridine(34) synthase MnmH [Sphingobacteriales bacterium]